LSFKKTNAQNKLCDILRLLHWKICPAIENIRSQEAEETCTLKNFFANTANSFLILLPEIQWTRHFFALSSCYPGKFIYHRIYTVLRIRIEAIPNRGSKRVETKDKSVSTKELKRWFNEFKTCFRIFLVNSKVYSHVYSKVY